MKTLILFSYLVLTSLSLAEDDYFPLKVGNEWTYEVTNGGTFCGSGEVVSKVRESFDKGGVTHFKVDPICKYYGPGAQIIWEENDKIYTYIATSAVSNILSLPPEQDKTWSINSAVSATWHKVESITVPAGTFTNCWEVRQNKWGAAIYCPNIGAVRGNGDNGYKYELKSWKF